MLVAHEADLLGSIGLCVVTAAVLALVAHRLRQPLLLAYLLAGVVIGPELGFGWVHDAHSIHTVSEIGLILLLFIIGLEIDLKKLLAAGKPVLVTGLLQFPLCVLLGLGFFRLLGYRLGGGDFALLYLAACLGISSTMIVVKLLYDKFELDTLPGRLTLGILVFQDIWAIVVLAIQPSLAQLELAPLLASLTKGVLVVWFSFAASKLLLPPLFRSVARSPELVLIAAMAWCFAVCGAADAAGLSREMGALIAGLCLSTFPYTLDVTAKVVSVRDFFVTLFFVALGMQIPRPSTQLLAAAAAAAICLVATRFVTIFPLLHLLRLGHRASLLPAINLSQISEFSMVIAALGLAHGHIDNEVVGVLIFVFVLTSVGSTYLITASERVQAVLGRGLTRLGIRDLALAAGDETPATRPHRLVFLGFYREASSLLHEFELEAGPGERHPLVEELLVIDFNPEVQRELQARGIPCVYGDIAHLDTLHHAEIHHAQLVVSTVQDSILKGTDNLRLLQAARRLCPDAKAVVTADRIDRALALYEAGADYVLLPRLQSCSEMAAALEEGFRRGFDALAAAQREDLARRREVLA